MAPTIEHAEALQGFERGWTKAADTGGKNNPRWKLVGSAVTVNVTRWLASRFDQPGEVLVHTEFRPVGDRWPNAARGDTNGRRFTVDCSTWPVRAPYQHLTDICDPDEGQALSPRAVSGFLSRLRRGSLNRKAAFESDVEAHAGLGRLL